MQYSCTLRARLHPVDSSRFYVSARNKTTHTYTRYITLDLLTHIYKYIYILRARFCSVFSSCRRSNKPERLVYKADTIETHITRTPIIAFSVRSTWEAVQKKNNPHTHHVYVHGDTTTRICVYMYIYERVSHLYTRARSTLYSYRKWFVIHPRRENFTLPWLCHLFLLFFFYRYIQCVWWLFLYFLFSTAITTVSHRQLFKVGPTSRLDGIQ